MRLLLCAVAALALTATASAQNPGLTAAYGEISLEGGFQPDPHVVELTAGGSESVSVTGACDYGVVAEAPDFEVSFEDSATGSLYIYAVSSEDTTILVNLPDGSWMCDDDSYGDGDPILEIENPGDGIYDIWVGTYGDDTAAATLGISEVDPR